MDEETKAKLIAAIQEAVRNKEKHFLSPEEELEEFGLEKPKTERHIFIGNFHWPEDNKEFFDIVLYQFNVMPAISSDNYTGRKPLFSGATEGTAHWLIFPK